jgi:hypothetical protein
VVGTVGEGANEGGAASGVVLEDLFDRARAGRDGSHFHREVITEWPTRILGYGFAFFTTSIDGVRSLCEWRFLICQQKGVRAQWLKWQLE